MVSFLVNFVVFSAFIWAWIQIVQRWPRWKYSLLAAIWCTFWVVVDIFTHAQLSLAINVLMASYWWREVFKNKPPTDRKKVAKLVGAKAKAIKAKVVAAMPKASPVSKPTLVPVGA
jgi:hypothetical protein